jgi:hypothetical protein
MFTTAFLLIAPTYVFLYGVRAFWRGHWLVIFLADTYNRRCGSFCTAITRTAFPVTSLELIVSAAWHRFLYLPISFLL